MNLGKHMAQNEFALSQDAGPESLNGDLSSDEQGSLDRLFNDLQGNGPKILGDAGLARLSGSRLLSIEHGARSRADDCLHDVQSLARLLTQALLETDRPVRPADAAAAARHLGQLTQDCERWNLLAEHAAMYRVQRPVAAEVARHWTRWAQHFGEWPDAGTPASP